MLLNGQIRLHVTLETKREFATFFKTEKLSTSMILGCDFCVRHLEAMRSRSCLVQLDEGMTVPIVLRLSARPQDAQPLLADQVYVPRKKHMSPKIDVAYCTTPPAESQTWVQMKTKREGLV